LETGHEEEEEAGCGRRRCIGADNGAPGSLLAGGATRRSDEGRGSSTVVEDLGRVSIIYRVNSSETLNIRGKHLNLFEFRVREEIRAMALKVDLG
jgi:hypothetical protein